MRVMKSIKRVSDIPSWFDLSKYDALNGMSLRWWWCQIEMRTYLVNMMDPMTESLDSSFAEHQLPILQETPIIPLPEDVSGLSSMCGWNSLPIRSLTSMDVYQLYRYIPEKEWDKCEELTSARGESETSLGFNYEFSEISVTQNENKYAVCYPNGDLNFLSINLSASDKTLINEFKNWLKKHRKETNSTKLKSRIDESDINKWCDYKILPYIDLILWGYFNEIAINQNILGEVLFCDERDVDSTERIRQTTIPLAKKVFSNKMNSKIAFQFLEDERYKN